MHATNKTFRSTMMATIVLLAACVAQGAVVVPGTSNPYLAGMPNGTTGRDWDTAPAQSPVLAPVALPAGGWLEFFNATGSVTNHSPFPDPDPTFVYDFIGGPEGTTALIPGHDGGPEHSKSDMFAPICSLIGVFLDSSVPAGAAPTLLDFTTPASRDYLTLSPQLKQVFFIGDGQTSGFAQQKVFIPGGATRLYLGVMDGNNWLNNLGSHSVDIAAVPEPATMGLLAFGAVGLLLRKRKSR